MRFVFSFEKVVDGSALIPNRTSSIRHTRESGYPGGVVEKKPGFPRFTNQVQHFFCKVLQWDDSMNNFRLKNAVEFPDFAKPGKQSAKSRQLWIARHRL